MEEFESRFMRMYRERSFAERCFRYDDMKMIMEEAIPGIMEKVAKM